MASLQAQWAGNGGYLRSSSQSPSANTQVQRWCVCRRPSVSGQRKSGRGHRLCVAATGTGTGTAGLERLVQADRYAGGVRRKEWTVDKEEDRSKKLDQWMRESVVEIVNNIEEAPFLVHVYPDDDRKRSSPNAAVKLVVEKAVAEDWPAIRRRWESGSPTPNGVILVEELKIDASNDEDSDPINSQLNRSTKVWGLLILLELANTSGTLVSHTGYALVSLGKLKCCPTTCDPCVRNAGVRGQRPRHGGWAGPYGAKLRDFI